MLRDRNKHYPVRITPVGESMTQQHRKDETDINLLMKKHNRPGGPASMGMPIGNGARPGSVKMYVNDFLGGPPATRYHDMLNIVSGIQSTFDGLPAKVRRKFQTPEALVEFALNPDNRKEALDLNLITPTEEEAAAQSEDARRAAIEAQASVLRAAMAGTSTEAGNASTASVEALKPDPEAQPTFNQGGGKTKKKA